MRLIDADEVIEFAEKYYAEKGYDPNELHFSLNDIRGNYGYGLVDAIPVAFIEDYLTNVVAKSKYEHLRTHKWLGIKQLISAWRKENANSKSA